MMRIKDIKLLEKYFEVAVNVSLDGDKPTKISSKRVLRNDQLHKQKQ